MIQRGRLVLVEIDDEVEAAALANHPEQAEALLVVLRAVEAGLLTADGPAAVAVMRRMEGALLALTAMR